MKIRIRTPIKLVAYTALLALLSQLHLHADADGRPKERTAPLTVSLPAPASGESAIAMLGNDLAAVATAHGMTAEHLQQLFRQERELKVDRSGRLFYEDPALAARGTLATEEVAVTAEGAPPPDQAFLLHSRPGTKRILYLDFTGHVLSGTAWNDGYTGGASIVCPPWDIDGNPGVFGDTERTRIVQIWQRVSEDYAPFDVDVTTEDMGEGALTKSSSSDEYYGVRVLISPISSYFGNYGGIAYVGVFNYVGDYYKPALVFPEMLANGEKYIAEACSHEAGHTLGLSHDGKTDGTGYYSGQGSGQTGWAPIMGVGYYQNLSQWSKGEYTGANNTQDDLSILQNYLVLRPDDHGNTLATATVLPAGPTILATGIIETQTDQDVFRFVTGSGLVSINVNPADWGANLDIQAELYDSAGNLIASSNPLDFISANFNLGISAGTYYLLVRGTGVGDPSLTGYSRYASLGQYTISGTVVNPSGTVPPVAKAAASTNSANAPVAIQFNSTQSYDPDGSITAVLWTFGDGATSQSPNPSHTYSSSGQYSATLTVYDNSSLSGSDTIIINVLPPNRPPTASASATPTQGSAPLTVNFNASASSDADGTIISYKWDFGDGTTGTGVTAQHVYQKIGSYTARLMVTDNGGATNSTTVAIQAVQNPAKILRVSAIALSVSAKRTVDSRVTVTDGNGIPLSGVKVTGQWTGVVTGNSSASTDINGVVVLHSKTLTKSGTVTFTVSQLSKSGLVYDPSRNIVTGASIAAGSGL